MLYKKKEGAVMTNTNKPIILYCTDSISEQIETNIKTLKQNML